MEGRGRETDEYLQDPEDAKQSQEVSPESMDLDLEQVGLMVRAHDETSLRKKEERQSTRLQSSKTRRVRLTTPMTRAGNGLNDPLQVGGFSMLRNPRPSMIATGAARSFRASVDSSSKPIPPPKKNMSAMEIC